MMLRRPSRPAMVAFATPCVASMRPQQQQQQRTNAAPSQAQRRSTPLTSHHANVNVAPVSYDPSPTKSSQLVQLRLRLHLLQLSHQQRRRDSEPPTSKVNGQEDDALPPLSSDASESGLPQSNSPSGQFKTRSSSSSPPPPPPTPSSSSSLSEPESNQQSLNPLSSSSSSSSTEQQSKDSSYSINERHARSQRLRALWRDPQWRAAMLSKRRSPHAVARKSESLKRLWLDEGYREHMHKARLGRPPTNKGGTASPVTRLRMSAVRKGILKSEETKRRMSAAKKNQSNNDNWRRLISESRKGKTREYFAMKREFRALHRDLKLWSDSFKGKYGRLPEASTFEQFVAPMMVFRIRRYLTLRDTLGSDDKDIKNDIFK